MPEGGGQSRIFGLYSALARLGVDDEIVALVPHGEGGRALEIAPGVRVTRVSRLGLSSMCSITRVAVALVSESSRTATPFDYG